MTADDRLVIAAKVFDPADGLCSLELVAALTARVKTLPSATDSARWQAVNMMGEPGDWLCGGLAALRVGPDVCGEEGAMTTSGIDNPVWTFDVGVAIVAAEKNAVRPGDQADHADTLLPGYDEAFGLKWAADRGAAVVVKGGEAVRVATEAIAGQIGLAAQRIATAIEAQGLTAPEPGQLGLESVEVSFGITLTAGVQALFTAQAESSAQVNITLTRRSAASG